MCVIFYVTYVNYLRYAKVEITSYLPSVVHQQTVHLHCYGLSPDSPARDYWWGVEFYNASRSLSFDDIIIINESSSVLQNVDIMYAGVDPRRSPVPAVRASPSVPSMVNVTIENVALDATNFTEVRTSTIVYNCTVSNCRGKRLKYGSAVVISSYYCKDQK